MISSGLLAPHLLNSEDAACWRISSHCPWCHPLSSSRHHLSWGAAAYVSGAPDDDSGPSSLLHYGPFPSPATLQVLPPAGPRPTWPPRWPPGWPPARSIGEEPPDGQGAPEPGQPKGPPCVGEGEQRWRDKGRGRDMDGESGACERGRPGRAEAGR